MTKVADEIVERRLVLIKRQGTGLSHNRVQASAVGWIVGGQLLGSLLVGAELRGSDGRRYEGQRQHGRHEASRP